MNVWGRCGHVYVYVITVGNTKKNVCAVKSVVALMCFASFVMSALIVIVNAFVMVVVA